jgi:hypothetical protein
MRMQQEVRSVTALVAADWTCSERQNILVAGDCF